MTIPKAVLERRIVVRERSPIFVILLMRDCRIWTDLTRKRNVNKINNTGPPQRESYYVTLCPKRRKTKFYVSFTQYVILCQGFLFFF